MQKGNARKAQSVFMSFAVRAVEDEQNGNYQRAVEYWSKALAFARKEVNRDWASVRMAFCASAAGRGWGGQHAGN